MATLQEALAKLLRAKKPDEKAEAAKEGAEAMAEKLPAPVMPLEAVKKKRARLRQLDEETKD
jgi:hypothetical protein